MSKRVTQTSEDSRKDADMHLNVEKTKVIHVREQQKVSTTTAAEAKRASLQVRMSAYGLQLQVQNEERDASACRQMQVEERMRSEKDNRM